MLAAVILLINIRRRGWALPVLGVGPWVFVAVVVGAIYPAIVQAVKVKPAENAVEQTYIARNIDATALRLRHQQHPPGRRSRVAQTLTPPQVQANCSARSTTSSSGTRRSTSQTYTKLQATKSYYSFNTLAVDRYKVNGALDPRGWSASGRSTPATCPSQGWVNTHLQYTHGYAMIPRPSNQTNNGQPAFAYLSGAAGVPRRERPRSKSPGSTSG